MSVIVAWSALAMTAAQSFFAAASPLRGPPSAETTQKNFKRLFTSNKKSLGEVENFGARPATESLDDRQKTRASGAELKYPDQETEFV